MPISVHGIGMTLGLSCNISYSLEQYNYGFAVASCMHYFIQTLHKDVMKQYTSQLCSFQYQNHTHVCAIICRLCTCFKPSGAEEEVFMKNLVNTVATHTLHFQVIPTIVLSMYCEQVIAVFNEEGFQIPAPY